MVFSHDPTKKKEISLKNNTKTKMGLELDRPL
jgi:hypothetical protein